MTMKQGDDPADYTVDEVKAHFDTADEAERARILETEKAGRDRSGVAALSRKLDDREADADRQAEAHSGERAYDADGNVRPADARWRGGANDDQSAAELKERRERELERNRQLVEQQAAEQRAKDEARNAAAAGDTTAEPAPATGTTTEKGSGG